jgi:electron transfer flavoprotein alpha subunit
MSVFVVLEVRNGKITRSSWEAAAAAATLANGAPVTAVLLGANTEPLAAQAAAGPVARVLRVEHPLLAAYSSDGYVIALHQLFQKESPTHVVLPHTYQVRDFASRLATRFGQVLISDVIALEPGPTFVRQLFQGRMNAIYQSAGVGPCFVSVQAGAFRAAPLSQGTTSFVPKMPQEDPGASATEGSIPIEFFTPTIAPSDIRTTASEPFRATSQTVDLSSAQLIVSVGRGIKDAANMPIIQQLAEALGAELAASRPICDSGWLPMERQVGSSGQTVAPKLYLAIGISGAIQHLVGIKGSQCIVAINKDSNAPIFEIADYGIIGDLFEIVPALTAAINAAKS